MADCVSEGKNSEMHLKSNSRRTKNLSKAKDKTEINKTNRFKVIGRGKRQNDFPFNYQNQYLKTLSREILQQIQILLHHSTIKFNDLFIINKMIIYNYLNRFYYATHLFKQLNKWKIEKV